MRRMTAWSLGKDPDDVALAFHFLVEPLEGRLFGQTLRQCADGNTLKANTSVFVSRSNAAAFGEPGFEGVGHRGTSPRHVG